MTDIKRRAISQPTDLPPGSQKAWRELMTFLDELTSTTNATGRNQATVAKDAQRVYTAVANQQTAINDAQEQLDDLKNTYDPTEPILSPSVPSLASSVGTVSITWDGNLLSIPSTEVPEDGSGGATPEPPTPVPASEVAGFRYVYAEESLTGEEDSWTLVGQPLNEAGVIVVSPPVGSTRYYRLNAVNYKGIQSGPSDSANIVVVGVELTDLESDVTTQINTALTNAQDAANDATAALLKANDAVLDVVTEYAVNSSETVAPTTGWSTSQPTRTPGQFIWVRTITTYGDSSTAQSAPALMTGNSGAPGSPGSPGRGITSTVVTYQLSATGTTAPTGTWVATPPAQTTANPYLWTRTVITYSDASTTTSYSVGLKGTDGSNGSNGVGIASTAVTYQVGTSGTTAPTGTWSSTPVATTTGQFLWTRTIITYTNATTATAYSVSAHGSTGSNGSTGVSVSSVTPYYFQTSGSAPSVPTTSPPPAPWTTTEPGYVSSTTLYRSDRVLFSNGTFSYTPVSVVSAYTASTQAITVANLATAAAQGLVKASQADPGHAVGRLWLQLDAAGNTVGIKISNGTAWSSYALMADQILVPGSVGTVQIRDGAVTGPLIQGDAIDGKTITGATVRTAGSGQRLQLDEFGLRSFSIDGSETATLYSASGGMKLSGTLYFGDPVVGTESWLEDDFLRLSSTPGTYSTVWTYSDEDNSAHTAIISSTDAPNGGQARIDVVTNSTASGKESYVRVGGAKLQVYNRIEQSEQYPPNTLGKTKVTAFGPVPNNLNTTTNPAAFQVGGDGSGTSSVLIANDSGGQGQIQAVDTPIGGSPAPIQLNLNPVGGDVNIGKVGGTGKLTVNGNPILEDSGWVYITGFGGGWVAGTGSEQPRVRRIGSRVDLVGKVTRSSASAGLAAIMNVPVGFRTAYTSGNTPIGFAMESGGNAIMLYINNTTNNVFISTAWATSGTVGNTAQINFLCSWYVD